MLRRVKLMNPFEIVQDLVTQDRIGAGTAADTAGRAEGRQSRRPRHAGLRRLQFRRHHLPRHRAMEQRGAGMAARQYLQPASALQHLQPRRQSGVADAELSASGKRALCSPNVRAQRQRCGTRRSESRISLRAPPGYGSRPRQISAYTSSRFPSGSLKNSVRWPNGWFVGGSSRSTPCRTNSSAQRSTSSTAALNASCSDALPVGVGASFAVRPGRDSASVLSPI